MDIASHDAVPPNDTHGNADTIAFLTQGGLDPLFAIPPRSGVLSAWYGHVPFAYWIIRNLRPRVFVELGTHNGVSYAAFCDAAQRERLSLRCYAVDTWVGDEHAGHYGEDVYTDLKSFHDSRYAAFSDLIRSTFDEAKDYFQDGSIDLLHIDGCHSYEAITHDFENWKTKLSDRAVVLFHDTNVRERHFGVWRLWQELTDSYPHFEFLHEHGLGVLAYGRNPPEKILELCSLTSPAEISGIRGRFAASGRSCIVEAENVALLRDRRLFESATSRVDALTEELNDTRLLAQTIANARDAAHAERDQLLRDRDALQSAQQDAHVSIEALRAEHSVFQADRDRLSSAQEQASAILAGHAAKQSEALALRRECERLAVVARAQEHASSQSRADAVQDRAGLVQTRQRLEQSRLHLAEMEAQFIASTQVAQRLTQEVELLTRNLAAYEQSTAWRATWPIRAVGGQIPRGVRRFIRRSLKLVWWSVTPLSIARRFSGRRKALAPRHPGISLSPSAQGNVVLIDAAASAAVGRPDDLIAALSGNYLAAIDWYDPIQPDVSLIVLNWNRSRMTLLCLQHLWQRTTGYRYEIVVVDNGSAREDLQFLRDQAPLARIVALKTNRYFGEANNIGVEAARGRFVCLLNNDAFVHDNWLEPLMSALCDAPSVGAVGPRFIYPDGRLQEAGALVNSDATVVQLGKGQNAADPAFSFARTVDYVSAACVLLRRSDFLRALGFDLTWDPAYYEDVDLCLKLRLLGLKTVYCSSSTVTHIESATSSDTTLGLQLNNIVAINQVKFEARWGAYLRDQAGPKPELISQFPNLVGDFAGRRRVIIYTPYNLTPGGGERYILSIAAALRDAAQVTLGTPHPFSRTRLLTMGRDFDLQLDHVALLSMDRLKESQPFDVAFVVGNEIFPPAAGLAAHNVFICQFPFPIENPAYGHHVRPYWNDYEMLLCYSSFVERRISRIIAESAIPGRPIEILPPPVSLLPFSTAKRSQILHVGRFFTGGHCKRQDALIEAFRQLLAEGVDAELHLAGSIHPEAEHRAYFIDLVRSAAGLPVFFHVNCSSQKMAELYRDSRIYWHATGFGHDVEEEPHKTEHFGISVVEAMSAGCIPVVFNAGGPAEIVEDGKTGFHFRTIDELCERSRSLLQTALSEDLERLAAAAAGAAQVYDERHFTERALGLLQELCPLD